MYAVNFKFKWNKLIRLYFTSLFSTWRGDSYSCPLDGSEIKDTGFLKSEELFIFYSFFH